MQKDPRRNPNTQWLARRPKRTEAPSGEAPPKRLTGRLIPTIAPSRVEVSGEKRRSTLALPSFQPCETATPPLAPLPARRNVEPLPTRVVNVKNVYELTHALEHARPGDHIHLADGQYVLPNRRFSLRGTAERPIALVATGSQAELRGGNNAHTLHLERCEHFIVNGLKFAARGPLTARALNITESHHIVIVGCWFGPNAPEQAHAPIHFSSDTSNRYNHHNQVIGNVVYVRGCAAIHLGPGGGTDIRVVENDLRMLDFAPQKPVALVAVTAGSRNTYHEIIIRANQLAAETSLASGIVLAGVSGCDISGNTIRLARTLDGESQPFLELAADGQVSGLAVHHNHFSYDRPVLQQVQRANFRFDCPAQATITQNQGIHIGAMLAEGKFSAMVDLQSAIVEESIPEFG